MITQLTAKRGAQPALDAHRAPLTLYWVFWLFLIAGVAGDLVEIVFWLVTRGELTSRSSLIYGQFSIVWGAGAVLPPLPPLQAAMVATIRAARAMEMSFFSFMVVYSFALFLCKRLSRTLVK